MTTSSDEVDSIFHLRIKSFKDVEIAVPAGSMVAHLKQQVRAALLGDNNNDNSSNNNNSNNDRYLRLICKGRLLLPDDHPISDFNVQNGDVVHAVLAAAPHPPKPPETSTTGSTTVSTGTGTTVIGLTSTTMVHHNHNQRRYHRQRRRQQLNGIVVGPGGRVTRAPAQESSEEDESSDDELEDDEEVGVNTTTTTTSSNTRDLEAGHGRPRRQNHRRRRRGFDRLREPDNGYLPTALPRSEVNAIRAYFHRSVDRYQAQHAQDHLDESDVLVRRRLFEEDWMAQQGPTSELRLNLNQNTLLRLAALHNTGAFRSGMLGSGTTAAAATGGQQQQPPSHPYGSLTVGTDRDFLWGFILGYFVGMIVLVWVWMPSVPHKQKIGILTGISFQLAMNVFSTPPPPSSSSLSEYDYDYYGTAAAGGGSDGSGAEDYELQD